MVTIVGTEAAFDKLTTSLLYLEHDAIAAYEAAIVGVEDAGAKRQLEAFKADHLQHVSTLMEIAREIGIEAPTEGDAKEVLKAGKVKMASLIGDSAIFTAMRQTGKTQSQPMSGQARTTMRSRDRKSFSKKL